MDYTDPDLNTASRRRLFQLVLNHRGPLLLIVLAETFKAGTIILQMAVLAVCVDAVFLSRVAINDISLWLLFLSAAVFLRASLQWGINHLGQVMSSAICLSLRQNLLDKLSLIGPVRLRREKAGDLIAAHTTGVDKLEGFYSGFVVAAVQMAVVTPVIAIVVLIVDWPSGLVFMLTGPLIPLLMYLIGLSAETKIRQQWRSLRKMSSNFLDTVQGLETIRIFGRQDDAQLQIRKVSKLFRTTTLRVLQIAFLSGMVLELAASVSTAVVAVEVGVRLVKGWMPFSLGLFVLLLAPEFYLPFRNFGAQHHAAMEGAEAAVQVFRILDAPQDIPEARKGIITFKPPFFLKVMDVSFSYDQTPEHLILANVSLEAAGGRITAIVGASGSGKTTLLNLIAGFLPCRDGEILINATTVRQIDQKAYHQMISYTTQFPHLFPGTIAENIAMGFRQAGREDVLKAARAALADDFIRDCPEGYDTRLGESGMNISGGQRQRIALARSLIKRSPILLLDEPANSLDDELERELMESLRLAMADQVILMASHREQTIRYSDFVYVLDKGKVVESGSPAQLLGKDSFLNFILRELV